ncbi:MAG: hypothetical protein IIT98_06190, partial [Kiritimatiellae bacterium]|nr:hypothetical protein [Kiritimatiellia bacterium]
AAAGFAIGRGSADMTYLQIVEKGAQTAREHLPLAIAAALAATALYFAAAKLVKRAADGRRER